MFEGFWADLWLFLPAFAANATPVIAKHIPGLQSWNTPISESLLGKNKTWRGFIVGIVIAVVVALLQALVIKTPLPYAALVGLLLGMGALTADSLKSMFKRRLGILPGHALPVIDGIDYIVGAIVFLSPLYVPSLLHCVLLLLIAPIASLLANTTSYFLGLKQQWY